MTDLGGRYARERLAAALRTAREGLDEIEAACDGADGDDEMVLAAAVACDAVSLKLALLTQRCRRRKASGED